MNSLLVAAIVPGLLAGSMLAGSPSVAAAEGAAIHGRWRMGPSLDASLWGSTTGNGAARFSAYYHAGTNRVYFLGGRDEDNYLTFGTILSFDPVSRTYADTGAAMLTPVSNYFIVPIHDDGRGHGPGLYVVGGRTGAGAQSSALQVYYPGENTAQTIASDPFPASPARTPGGVVSVDEKIYVFGGFDGTTVYADTWVYDPLGAAGSRWTDLGRPLPTARAYIAAVAVGSLIYAIGGDEFPGGSLTPLADTVALDTGNLAAGWQDGLMADLPEANGDAPAVYVGEGPLGGGIYVAGGIWPSPGPYRWVFRYDAATDTWQELPDLAIPAPATGRRNQALVYLPASAGGVAGLWTFGGYDGSGPNAMTETSEFFAERQPVCVPTLNLLLLK